jgi:hypothetical protein
MLSHDFIACHHVRGSWLRTKNQSEDLGHHFISTEYSLSFALALDLPFFRRVRKRSFMDVYK